jgi:hypothetical protein
MILAAPTDPVTVNLMLIIIGVSEIWSVKFVHKNDRERHEYQHEWKDKRLNERLDRLEADQVHGYQFQHLAGQVKALAERSVPPAAATESLAVSMAALTQRVIELEGKVGAAWAADDVVDRLTALEQAVDVATDKTKHGDRKLDD